MSIAEWWTKTSAVPSSGAMKPKPLSGLNHFTVPCAICAVSFKDELQARAVARASCWLPAIGRKDPEPNGETPKLSKKCGRLHDRLRRQQLPRIAPCGGRVFPSFRPAARYPGTPGCGGGP